MKGNIMYSTRNPYAKNIENAENLQVSLHNIATDFESVIERKHVAVQAYTAAQRAYEDQEAEFLFSISMTDPYQKGKNAETRKMIQDLALIKARNAGPLRMAWGALNQATNVKESADLAFVQAEAKFKAVRVAAELQAAMLRAAALG
jgi:hypothetical protein